MGNVRTAGAVCFGLVAFVLAIPVMAADRIRVATSEFVYSDLALQIGGPAVTIDLLDRQKAIAGNGAAALSAHDFILYDGTVKDAWLRAAVQHVSPQPIVLEASHQTSDQDTVNFPWYDLKVMSGLGQDFAKQVSERDPGLSQQIAANLARYMESFQSIDRQIAEMAKNYDGSEVFVTDNMFRGILQQLHFKIQDQAYARSAQNGALPSAASLAALKEAISTRDASILIYDRDVMNPTTKSLVAAANDAGVPVVGLREKLPTALHYQQWMMRQLNAVQGALNEAAP